MIKVSLIVLLGLGAAALLRKRSAAVRHWVLAAAIVCAAATPALELIVPSWHLPLNASWFGGRAEPLTLLIPVPETRSFASAAGIAREPAAPVEKTAAVRWIRQMWTGGAAISLSMLLIGLARLSWLASQSQTILHGKWAEFASALSLEYGLRRPVRLLESDHPTLLVTWGLLQPKVILPRAARDWPEDRVRIVLGHELAHVRRRDWLVHMTAELLRSVYWFNPLLWLVCSRLRQESERACDDAVLSLGVEGPDYATHLLDLARAFRRHQRIFFPAPAMARPSSLERRINAMLNGRLNRRPMTRSACLVTAIALLTVTVLIAGLGASAQSAAATFSGTVVDAVGRILPDLPMVLSNVESGKTHDARSDQAGHFTFPGLPAGDYLLEVRKPGFATSQGRVTLGAGQNLYRDVALQLGSIMETITIPDKEAPPPPPPPPPLPALSVSQPDFDPCSQSPVGGCIVPPRKVRDVRPRYPQSRRDAGIAGTVELEGRVGTDGFLKHLRVLTAADTEFANEALEAIQQWQFTPTRLDGVPVEVQIHVRASFFVQR